ncbi:MAG: hypothetical protein PHW63_08945 [Alphaproteobacteria bacterium]|nr:hypothetical protein [Alphaproteobacteria bacterium]
MQITFTKHFKDQMNAKGIPVEHVLSALGKPERITPVMTRPEFAERKQMRYCGAGVAVVVEPTATGSRLCTLYLDRVRTPLREDQRNDPYAMSSTRAIKEKK